MHDQTALHAELIEIAAAMEALTIRLGRFRQNTMPAQDRQIERIAAAGFKVSAATRKLGNNLR